jgi:hypothetical protein
MSKIDVCYVISHGFAARMLVQTGLIRKLADKGKRIAIVIPDAQDPNFKELQDHSNIEVYECAIKLSIFDDDYGFKRRYFLEDIKANPVFWEKHIHSLYYSKSKHPWKRIRPIYYYAIYKLIKVFPGIRRRFATSEKRHLESTEVEDLLSRIDPSAVVSTYPINYLEAKFLYAAEKKGIKKIIHLLSWDNITSKGIFPIKADHYIAWGPVMAEEFRSYYKISDNELSICGVPHFDHHINKPKSIETIERLGLDPEKPILFFAMSSPRFAPYEIEVVEELAKWDYQMIVRPHPQNVTGAMADLRWISRLDELKSERVAISYPSLQKSNIRWSMKNEDMDELTDIIHFSTLNINSGSTVSIDALVLNKPVIIAAFDARRKLKYWKSVRRLLKYIHLEKFIALGGAEVASDFEELRVLIDAYISNSDRRQEERSNAILAECFKLDGASTERVVETMIKHV